MPVPAKNVLCSTPVLRDMPRSLAVRSLRTGETLDYAGIEARVAARSEELRDLLPADSSRVVISLSDPIEALVSLFATWVAGQCAVMVNPGLATDEKARVTAKVTPALWVEDTGLRVVTDTEPQPSPWRDAALILMTSGTTGDPKGVTHSLATLDARLKLNVAEIGTDALARTLCPLPLFFGHGLIGNCLTALCAGQSLFLHDAPGLSEFAGFGETLTRHEITFLSSVPSMWRMVLRLSPPPVSPPQRVHVGSAPLTEELWRAIEDWSGTRNVVNTYGMTETANWISGGTRPPSNADGYVGAPWGGTFQVLRDGAFHTSGRGEVALRSPSLMLGLWGDSSPADRDAPFLTGDIGELSDNQTLRLVGRSKNEINRAGIKVLAEEVDMLLERHPDVVEACAFGIPDAISGELVGAVVRLADDAQVADTDLIAWCRTQARQEAVPSRIGIVDEIAKTDRGKLARQTIQKEMIASWC